MDVMAGRAGHRRAGAETFALAQQCNLIAVNVRSGIGLTYPDGRIIKQTLTRLIRERRFPGFPCTRMTQGAIIQLPVARKARGIEDVLTFLLSWVGILISNVLIALAVASYTADAQFVIA